MTGFERSRSMMREELGQTRKFLLRLMHTEPHNVVHGHAILRRDLRMATRVEDWNFTSPPSPPGPLPTDTFKMERVIHINGTAIALRLYAPAHTDRTSPCISSMPMCSTRVIRGGMAYILSSTTRLVAA